MTKEMLDKIIELQIKAFDLLCKIESAEGKAKDEYKNQYDGIIEVLKVYSK